MPGQPFRWVIMHANHLCAPQVPRSDQACRALWPTRIDSRYKLCRAKGYVSDTWAYSEEVGRVWERCTFWLGMSESRFQKSYKCSPSFWAAPLVPIAPIAAPAMPATAFAPLATVFATDPANLPIPLPTADIPLPTLLKNPFRLLVLTLLVKRALCLVCSKLSPSFCSWNSVASFAKIEL